jgi:hypothetical protein
MNLLNEMQTDVSAPSVNDEAIGKISTLAQRQLTLQNQIEEYQEIIADLAGKLKKVQEEELPTAMQEAGVSEFKLTTGNKITIKPFYSGSITDENREEAFGWLADNDMDDLIKTDFTVKYGKGEDDKAEDLQRLLTENNVNFSFKKHIHPQTLSAFIKEQVEGGNSAFPLETFKVYSGKKAIIK